jgi:hypothetical protein
MKPHRMDGISLSFGLIFVLIAFWWALAQFVRVQLPAAGWLVAGALIMFGALGLIGAIRSGRRTEVPAPVQAEAQVETPGDLPPQMHADIVRELLDNPADRVDLHPAYLKHPVQEAPAYAPPTYAPPASAPPASAPPVGDQATTDAADEATAEVTRTEPVTRVEPVDGAEPVDPTRELPVDPNRESGDADADPKRG